MALDWISMALDWISMALEEQFKASDIASTWSLCQLLALQNDFATLNFFLARLQNPIMPLQNNVSPPQGFLTSPQGFLTSPQGFLTPPQGFLLALNRLEMILGIIEEE